MDRLEKVRKVVDNILIKQSNIEERHCGYVHLYGVASNCSLLALKRGANVELCTIAGMLHDIFTYKTGNSIDHAILGSIEARKILTDINCFMDEEINIICSSISNHSNKQDVGNVYDEILKDADVLQHYLYNTSYSVDLKEKGRLNKVLEELGIKCY